MDAGVSKFIDKLWYGRTIVAGLLLPLAWIYAWLMRLRRVAYARGWLASPELPLPVIVVGNISVGGTGKTPIVVWLAEQLRRAGHKPGIVSRGYGASPNAEAVLVTPGADPQRFGDEPVLLAEQSGCPVCVCIDRVAAVRRVADEGVTVVISDDGLQHYRMRRVVELAVIDGQRAFGNGYLLPAGPLREPISRLQTVDAVLVNGGTGKVAGLEFSLVQGDAVNLRDGSTRPLSYFSGVFVWAVAGIGNPDRFESQLRDAGVLVNSVHVADHGAIGLSELLSQRSQPVLMTSKDAVKYRYDPPAECWYIPVTVVFNADDAAGLMRKVTAALGAVS